MSEMNYTRRCAMCGDIMENVGYTRMYCDTCKKIHKRRQWVEWNKNRVSGTLPKNTIATRPNKSYSTTAKGRAEKRADVSDELLREKCRVADWLGITYGNLMKKSPEEVAELTRQYYEAQESA